MQCCCRACWDRLPACSREADHIPKAPRNYTDEEVARPAAALVEAESKGTAARAKQAVGTVQGVAGAISGVAKGLSDPLSAYFEAEANKEIARQKTNQAALKENQPILHELDIPFITLKLELGTRRRPIPVSINLSLLNLFGLGDFAERVLADSLALRAKNIPNNFSKEWDDVRTPRTAVPGSTVTALGTGVPPEVATAAETVKAANAAYAEAFSKWMKGA